MIREQIGTGKTIELAVEAACEKLEISRDEAQYEVLERPKAGFLGIGARPAKVRVYIEYTKAGRAVEYLQQVLGAMGFSDVSIDVKEEENGAVLTLSGEGLGVIIGRRGETLDALQYLAGLVANKLEGDYYRITLDSGNYREKREKTLEALAKKLALNAVKTGKSSTLEPMNPYERRIIHAAVQQVQGATSTSIGDEPNRRIVISSTVQRRPSGRPPRGGARGGNGRYGNAPKYEEGKRSRSVERNYSGQREHDGIPAGDSSPVREETMEIAGNESAHVPAPKVEENTIPVAPKTKLSDNADQPLYSKIEI